MTNEEKAKHIADVIFERSDNETFYNMAVKSAIEMAKWKDEEYAKMIESLQRKLMAEEGYRRQIEQSVRSLPNSVKDLIRAFNMMF